jgi:hypothetical protein
MSCDLLIFMAKTAEPVVSVDVAGTGLAALWKGMQRSGLSDRALRAMASWRNCRSRSVGRISGTRRVDRLVRL